MSTKSASERTAKGEYLATIHGYRPDLHELIAKTYHATPGDLQEALARRGVIVPHDKAEDYFITRGRIIFGSYECLTALEDFFVEKRQKNPLGTMIVLTVTSLAFWTLLYLAGRFLFG